MTDETLAKLAKSRQETGHLKAIHQYNKWIDSHTKILAEQVLRRGMTKLEYGIVEKNLQLVEDAYEMIIAGTEWLYVDFQSDSML